MGYEENNNKIQKKRKEIVNELQVDYSENDQLKTYDFQTPIGMGSFGRVFKAKSLVDHQDCAIKVGVFPLHNKKFKKEEDYSDWRGEYVRLVAD